MCPNSLYTWASTYLDRDYFKGHFIIYLGPGTLRVWYPYHGTLLFHEHGYQKTLRPVYILDPWTIDFQLAPKPYFMNSTLRKSPKAPKAEDPKP